MPKGLPRAPDNSKPKDAFNVVLCGGIERLTSALIKGDPFTEKGLQEMEQLERRLSAFSNALAARKAAMNEVIE